LSCQDRSTASHSAQSLPSQFSRLLTNNVHYYQTQQLTAVRRCIHSHSYYEINHDQWHAF